MASEAESVSKAAAFAVTKWRPVSIAGPEDITIDHVVGKAYISSEDRWRKKGTEPVCGGIFALDLTSQSSLPEKMSTDLPEGFIFHPHGLTLFRSDSGDQRLFVINHRSERDHVIEVFDIDGDRLRHARTIADVEHLVSPNDLIALDGDRFYVTNDRGARQTLLQVLETGVGLPWSTVVFFDGGRFHTVARHIEMANGIALDHNRGRLYVAASRAKRLYDFAWNDSNPAKELSDPRVIELPGCPDNLEWDEDGNLWIGADPSFLRIVLYFERIMATAPSLVLCLRFVGEAMPRIEEVFRDDTGEKISASSVAAVYGRGPVRRLLIGAPFDDHLLDCELQMF